MAMDPRTADIVFALGPVPTVVAVYALPPRPNATSREESCFDFVVDLRPWSWRSVMQVQARLLEVLTHEETGRVEIRDADVPKATRFMDRATRLTLTPAEREAARLRAETRPPRAAQALGQLARARFGSLEVPEGGVARRPRVVLVDADPAQTPEVLSELGAEVLVLGDPRVPREQRLTLAEILPKARMGEIDLALVESSTPEALALPLWNAFAKAFDSEVREHFFYISWLLLRSPRVRVMAKTLPFLDKPLRVEALRKVLDDATRWHLYRAL